ncbi:Crp/Fnr family transcriptional regulator [Acinetobacter puyangensis]|uniref:cAMP-binding domain of CRP or a regulatory subunit of cAMP-dependent protein kinases n=1 Tax=Acinetobacter puyangensis TaxID=1096779 RepID=A0A240ECR0_9GAMM|nr:Crp/Fnr family transcriptional regulator [Acinetobacter puyangensis]SNX45949.1 cAMP-binding domain of CRP or a regulatory subunit of cAMP-dependent protein kinases [Acinetobacter puyangensis]
MLKTAHLESAYPKIEKKFTTLPAPIQFQNKSLQHTAQEFLLNYKLIQLCTPEQQQEIFKHLKISRYHSNEMIFHKNTSCNELTLILRGSIKLAWHIADGKQIVHRFIPAGCLINIVPLISRLNLTHDHVAHDATVIATIPGHIFYSILKQNHQVSLAVLELICNRNHLLFDDFYHQSTQSLRGRLARHLLLLVEYFSYQDKQDTTLNIKLSQENFAELLHTSRQSINKELLWLAQQGIAEVKYNQIHILNLGKLRSLIHL